MAKNHISPTRYRWQKSEASISVANTFTAPVEILGEFNFSLSGTWAGTVTIQRSFDAGATWVDVAAYTANIQDSGFEPELNMLFRAGFKAGEYTSGTAVVRLSQ